MADFPNSPKMSESVLRKIRKPLIEKKRSHDQFKINLLENVKTKDISSGIGEANDVQSTPKYTAGNPAINKILVAPTYFTPLYVDIPQYPSTTATTPDVNGGLLMPVPGYPVKKTENVYCPYYFPTMKNDLSVNATAIEDPLLNQSSLNEQTIQGLDSSASGQSLRNSAGSTTLTNDNVWRPW